ncbi:hypothetical protein [Kitasatospora sp. NPDC087315]
MNCPANTRSRYDSTGAVSLCGPELAGLAITLAKGIGIGLHLST